MSMRSAVSATTASSDDRESQQDHAAEEDEDEQRRDEHIRAKLAPSECAKGEEHRGGADHAHRSADDRDANEHFCEFGIHGLALLHGARAQLGHQSDQPPPFRVRSFPGTAERFQLFVLFVRGDSESVRRLRRRLGERT